MNHQVLLPRIEPERLTEPDRLTGNFEQERLTEPGRLRPHQLAGARHIGQNDPSEDGGRKTAGESRAPPNPRTGRPAPRRYAGAHRGNDSVVTVASMHNSGNGSVVSMGGHPHLHESGMETTLYELDASQTAKGSVVDAPKLRMADAQKVRLADAPKLRLPKEVQSALEAVTGMLLHKVYVGQAADDRPRVVEEPADRYDCSRRIYDIPVQADAVLLLCYVTFSDAALTLVKGFKKLSYTPPILPLVLRPDGEHFDGQQINNVSTKLTKAGADDVMVQPRNKLDLPDMLQTSLALVEMNWQVEQHLIEEIDSRTNTLFFQSVDKIIQGFPKLNVSAEETVPSRATLGGIGRHVFERVIGSGKYGKVYMTRSESSDKLCDAVKVIPKRTIKMPKHANQVLKECRLMQKVSGHPNIVEYRGLVHARRNIYIFMEFAGTADLIAVIRNGKGSRLESAYALELLLQIVDAVAHCHKCGVAHRDINSENIVVSSQNVPKLVDFGSAVVLSDSDSQELCQDMCGTIPFAPPEVFRGKKFDPQAMDIWSFGILALEMRCGNNSVCRMLGCIGVSEPTPALADVFESFFNDPEWPRAVQQNNGFGMAPELLTIMRCSLVVRPELRWRASDLWQHIANCSRTDRFTRPTQGADDFELQSLDMSRMTAGEDRNTNTPVMDIMSDDAQRDDGDLLIGSDAFLMRQSNQAARARVNMRRLRP